MLFELLVEITQLVFFLFLQVANRDVRLFFDDLFHVLNGYRCGLVSMIFFGILLSLGQLGNLIAIVGGLFIILAFNGLLLVSLGRVNLIFDRCRVGGLQGQVLAGSGFVQQVNRLVGQEPILNIAIGQLSRGLDGIIGVLDVVEVFIAALDTV